MEIGEKVTFVNMHKIEKDKMEWMTDLKPKEQTQTQDQGNLNILWKLKSKTEMTLAVIPEHGKFSSPKAAFFPDFCPKTPKFSRLRRNF